ncbi:MAG: bifunctional 3-deoxy-7-phosphoheptulonate synthase/chorismate mutase type II, partial [Muribaculaceae bacterium]|nr:bifunctional 3-deoxy-7-phosphoheptulonate synthase/chorismate mutase type II [Muribaculaceae bacterium]
DMGFDGLIIESHCDPDCAWSDKDQQVTPEILNVILNSLVVRDEKITTENLTMLRQQIDEADNELLEILSKRMRICREIGQYKKEHGMTVLQSNRYDEIMQSRVKLAEEMGMSGDFMKVVLISIHEESVRQQLEIFNNKA